MQTNIDSGNGSAKHHHFDIKDAKVPGEESRRIVAWLNGVLANEYAVFTKTLNYHWNITGPRFFSLHKFLEGQYRELLEIMDAVAERVRVLDAHPISTIKKMYANMEVQDGTDKTPSTEDMLKILLRDHLTIQAQLKEIVAEEDLLTHDPGTQDFLIGLLQQHEKMGWMIKSHLV